MITLNTADFVYTSDTKTFTTFATDISRDGLPLAFGMKSQKTGKVEEVRHANTYRDSDNDIMFWDYKFINPSLSDQRVRIYND